MSIVLEWPQPPALVRRPFAGSQIYEFVDTDTLKWNRLRQPMSKTTSGHTDETGHSTSFVETATLSPSAQVSCSNLINVGWKLHCLDFGPFHPENRSLKWPFKLMLNCFSGTHFSVCRQWQKHFSGTFLFSVCSQWQKTPNANDINRNQKIPWDHKVSLCR